MADGAREGSGPSDGGRRPIADLGITAVTLAAPGPVASRAPVDPARMGALRISARKIRRSG